MLWLLAIVPGLAAALPTLLGSDPSRRALAGIGAGAMLLTLALAALAVGQQWTAEWSWSARLLMSARLDSVSSVMALLVPSIALPVLLYAALQQPREGLARLVALLVGFVAAMELLVIADDLLTLLIGWELVGACSWALITHDWREPAPPRDAATAFLATRAGDLGLFVAAMATFAATGSFSYAALGSLEGTTLEIAVAGLLIAAAAKSAQLPFSFWLFNAMSGPSPVSALLHAATMVAAGAYLLARLQPILAQISWFPAAVLAIGLTTALAGAVVALLHADVKKVLAGSTSAHYGMMFVAAGTGHPAVATLYLVVHAGYKSLLFLGAGAALTAKGTHALAKLRFGPRLPAVAVLVAMGSAALAGIPPTGGAWTKELVDAAAGQESIWLAAGVLLAGALSAAYAMRWQWLAFGPGEFGPVRATEGPRGLALVSLIIPAAFTIALSLLWLPVVHEAVDHWFPTSLPSPKTWERIAAAVLLLGGLLFGWGLARRWPTLGERGWAAAVADWFGLPKMVHVLVTRPTLTWASRAARFDDHVIDGTVERIAGAARTLAALGSELFEVLVDGVVEGTARVLDRSGARARQLETGLAHHYLVWVAAGAALLTTFMLLAG